MNFFFFVFFLIYSFFFSYVEGHYKNYWVTGSIMFLPSLNKASSSSSYIISYHIM